MRLLCCPCPLHPAAGSVDHARLCRLAPAVLSPCKKPVERYNEPDVAEFFARQSLNHAAGLRQCFWKAVETTVRK